MKKMSTRFVNIIELIILAITGGVTIIIAALDLIGILDVNSWIVQRIPTLTLLAVGSIASYLLLERRGKLDELTNLLKQHDTQVDSSFTRAIRSLDGVEVKTFEEGSKFVSYFLSRVKNAKRIDDISWNEEIPVTSKKEMDVYAQYRDVLAEVASKSDVVWREIVMFVSETRYNQIRQHLLDKIPGYSVVFYDLPQEESPPRLSFAIVDQEEVFLASYKLRLAVRHPDIVNYFSQYYELVWSRGKPLKIGKKIEMEKMESVSYLDT